MPFFTDPGTTYYLHLEEISKLVRKIFAAIFVLNKPCNCSSSGFEECKLAGLFQFINRRLGLGIF